MILPSVRYDFVPGMYGFLVLFIVVCIGPPHLHCVSLNIVMVGEDRLSDELASAPRVGVQSHWSELPQWLVVDDDMSSGTYDRGGRTMLSSSYSSTSTGPISPPIHESPVASVEPLAHSAVTPTTLPRRIVPKATLHSITTPTRCLRESRLLRFSALKRRLQCYMDNFPGVQHGMKACVYDKILGLRQTVQCGLTGRYQPCTGSYGLSVADSVTTYLLMVSRGRFVHSIPRKRIRYDFVGSSRSAVDHICTSLRAIMGLGT